MSNSGQQPPASAFRALLAGAAISAAVSVAAAGVSAARRRLVRPPISREVWETLFDAEGRVADAAELFRRAQQGVEPAIRESVWPFLLQLYPAGSSAAERQRLHSELDDAYSSLLNHAQASCRAPAGAASSSGGGAGGDADACGSSAAGEAHSAQSAGDSAFLDVHRCIIMDVLRTDFGAVDSSGLSGDAAAAETPVSNAGSPGLSGEAAAVEPPASDAGPPAAQCVSAAAQEALVQAQYMKPAARRQAMRLFNLLAAHAVHDPGLGYAQGMSDLAAPFLLVFPRSDAMAYWCFQHMMVRAREGFRHDECGIRRQLRQVAVMLSRVDMELHQRLKELQVGDCLFAYRLVIVLLLRDLKTPEAVRLWECSWADQSLQDSLASPAGGAATSIASQNGAASAASAAAARTAQGGSAARALPSLLLCFVLAVICSERRAVFQQCTSGDEVFCHFASLQIDFGRTLDEARRLQQE